MMKLTVPNVIQNLPHIWFAIKKFIFRQIQFFRFSQSLVITSLSIKADIFSRRCRHLYNVSQEVVKYFAERWRPEGERFAWDLFIPTSSSDQQLLRLFCAREQNREAVSALPVPPPVLARGCPACNKWHRFQKNSPPDFSRFLAQISPPDITFCSVTRLKDSNWWNEVSKSPITKAAHSSASLTAAPVEEIIIKVDIGLKEITIHNYEAHSWMCVRIPKYTP